VLLRLPKDDERDGGDTAAEPVPDGRRKDAAAQIDHKIRVSYRSFKQGFKSA
jgi:hypothetical protein